MAVGAVIGFAWIGPESAGTHSPGSSGSVSCEDAEDHVDDLPAPYTPEDVAFILDNAECLNPEIVELVEAYPAADTDQQSVDAAPQSVDAAQPPQVRFSVGTQDALTVWASYAYDGLDYSSWTYETSACEIMRDIIHAAKVDPNDDLSSSDLQFTMSPSSNFRITLEHSVAPVVGSQLEEVVAVTTSNCMDYIDYFE